MLIRQQEVKEQIQGCVGLMCCRGKNLQHLVSIVVATGRGDHYSLAGTL